MAERKSGPVKPPVIDLKARDAMAEQGPEAPARRGGRAKTARRGAKPDDDARPGDAEAPAAAAPAGGSSDASGTAPEGTEGAAPAGRPTDDAGTPRAAEAPPPEPPGPALPPEDNLAGAKPAPDTEPAPDNEPTQAPLPPPPPRPPARLAMPWSAISIAAVAGALLGAGLTYLAANWIALPTEAPPFDDPGPAVTALAERTARLESRLASVEETALDTQMSLDATLVQLDTLGSDLRGAIDELRAAIPEAQDPVDLAAIEEQLQNLDSRVTAIAAGASSDDASALADSLANIEAALADLTVRMGTVDERVAAADDGLTALRGELDDAKAAIAAQNRSLAGADVGPAVKLPLIVSGLEAAFAGGRPYDAELAGLMALLPDLTVPAAVAENAETGLARPDALLARFEDRLPAILAGRTAESTGNWTADALEWAKALLALRPSEEIEGSTPEAVVSRLEGAVERRNYAAAAALLGQLPAPMREAAGEVGADVAALAEAEAFVASLRAEALAPAEPSN